MLKRKIKRLIGQELHLLRHQRHLQMQEVVAKTRIGWSKLDSIELGNNHACWYNLQALLDFYNKDIQISLIDKAPAADTIAAG